MLIYGKEIRNEMQERIKSQVAGKRLKLSVVQVGEEAASASYVNAVRKFADEVGVGFEHISLPVALSQAGLIEKIQALNQEPAVTGIMLQTPLPGHMDKEAVINSIDPKKDVEGIHNYNLGRLLNDPGGLAPCTAKAVMSMLKWHNIPLRGKRVTLVGQSVIVGKPLALMLMNERATVTVCNSGTVNLKTQTEAADIVVAAVGQINLITPDMVSPSAVVIDVGTNFDSQGKMRGDVDPAVGESVHMLSAVPGGVGVITVAELFDNLVRLQ